MQLKASDKDCMKSKNEKLHHISYPLLAQPL